jgi:hypothetical protein
MECLVFRGSVLLCINKHLRRVQVLHCSSLVIARIWELYGTKWLVAFISLMKSWCQVCSFQSIMCSTFLNFGYGRESTFLVTMFYHRLRIQEEHLFLVTVGGRMQTTRWIASTGNLRFSASASPPTLMPLYSSNELEMVWDFFFL